MVVTRRIALSLAIPLIIYAGTACAAHRSQVRSDHTSNATLAGMSTSRDVLSARELQDASGSNALEVVRQLRPIFLRSRGPLHAPWVFVDNIPLGDVGELQRIPATSIREIRYLNARVATRDFGTGYSGGVIHVLTVNGPR